MTLKGAIKQLYDLQSAEDMPIYYKPAIAEVINVLVMDAQEVRYGQWVNHISENGATDGTYCGICDYEVDRDVRYNYCPNCGAKMDEVTDVRKSH